MRLICFRKSGFLSKGLYPNTDTSPCVGYRSPQRHLSVVVLPAPFGPINPTSSPSVMLNEILSTAFTVSYDRLRIELKDDITPPDLFATLKYLVNF